VSEREETPPIDPDAVHVAYRRARARRQARIEHRRRSKHAGVRFWVSLCVLLASTAAIAYGSWRVLQHLLGV
jgi:cytochrome c-type biogenesis protein CcmH/NrfG